MVSRQTMCLLTSCLRRLPDFIIAGEAKCGTTSLYRYMCNHPGILSADVKEPHNFIRYGASPHFCRQHYPLCTAFWLRRLRCAGMPVLTGEATANYFSTAGIPEKIKAVVPRVKIILAFRDPVIRAYSDYQMMRKGGFEKGEFNQGIEQALRWIHDPALLPLVTQARREGEGFLRYIFKGAYADHLPAWLRAFSPAQMLYVQSERFFENPQRELSRVFSFLSIPDHAIEGLPILKQGAYGDQWMAVDTERNLRIFYAPFNQRLEQMTSMSFNWPK